MPTDSASRTEFLGLPTPIVTDLDSVHPASPKKGRRSGSRRRAAAEAAEDAEEENDDDDDGSQDAEGEKKPKPRSKCPAGTPGAITANQTLLQWLPGKSLVDELRLRRPVTDFRPPNLGDGGAYVMVTYQAPVNATWARIRSNSRVVRLRRRFCMKISPGAKRRSITRSGCAGPNRPRCRSKRLPPKSTRGLRAKVKKTNFALGLLASSDASWVVPAYIQDGLDCPRRML